jgi:hypothetical protein
MAGSGEPTGEVTAERIGEVDLEGVGEARGVSSGVGRMLADNGFDASLRRQLKDVSHRSVGC